MTEPPAASALELLAIETTGCPVLALVLLVVVIAAYPFKPLSKKAEGGRLAAPTLRGLDQAAP